MSEFEDIDVKSEISYNENEDSKQNTLDMTTKSLKKLKKNSPKKLVKKPSKKLFKKPKVVSEWYDDDIYRLIECVEEYPSLWDNRYIQYRNKHIRTKLWNRMAAHDFNFKYEASELLAKWSNLRIQFRSIVSKQPKSGKISWKFYTAMLFLGETMFRQTISTSTETNVRIEDSASSSTSLTPQAPRQRRVSVEPSTSLQTIQTPLQPVATLVVESASTGEETSNQSKQQPQHSEEFEAFGKFLASELRSLDDIAMARRIKHKLNRYFLDVIDEEYDNLQKPKTNR